MRRQKGFTLIEILVTVVVLAIGLLGLAGLQATALRFNSTAYQRSQATILIYDIIERIRANAQSPSTTANQYFVCNEQGPGSCTAQAQQDIQAWQNAIAVTLPGVTARQIVPGTNNTLTVRITWDDSRGENPPQTISIRTSL